MTNKKVQEQNLAKILTALEEMFRREQSQPQALDLLRLQRKYLKKKGASQPFFTKAEILAAFKKKYAGQKLETWAQKLAKFLQVKPVRTQSGVTTITVLTKPWPCPGECIFCPSQIRMPKSYLASEPGAARAQANYFDPFLQVSARLENLQAMGHDLSKVELIVLGGTWEGYPLPYRIWFIKRLYDALNSFTKKSEKLKVEKFYQTLNQRLISKKALTFSRLDQENEKTWRSLQEKLENRELNYNQALTEYYLKTQREQWLAETQKATWEELELAQKDNQSAKLRNVGLVVETRPDLISIANLHSLRRLGCTKVQIGVQSVNDQILVANNRNITRERQAQAFALLRLFGFKIHAHFMANLYQATPESDMADYRDFMTSVDFLPDEVKIYPCSLLPSSELMSYYQAGKWQPYSEKTLLKLLTQYLLDTPAFVRVTRMIRDISSAEIVVGNKKTNFRQLVEDHCQKNRLPIKEIRQREVRSEKNLKNDFALQKITYQTSVSEEIFLQFVNSDQRIAGFLRLSLPHLPKGLVLPEELGKVAMIREVHVYGLATALKQKGPYQHAGLGKSLIKEAKKLAKAAGFKKLKVISAIGTKEYYEKLGFGEKGLYHEIDR